MANGPASLPPMAAFLHTILRYLSSQPEGKNRHEIRNAVADLLSLNESQRGAVSGRTGKPLHYYRTGWGLSILKRAALLDQPAQRLWRITNAGRGLIGRHPQKLDRDTARSIVRAFNPGTRQAAEHGDESVTAAADPLQNPPEERIEAALEEITKVLADNLIDRIREQTPEFFERLVLDLLHALGYGATREDLQHAGRAGDGGIDGVISLDRLGLEKIYVQAKRWQGTVGSAEVQSFYGALEGKKARKGVIITTSSFSRNAIEFATHVSNPIILIDGPRLTSLMIVNGVGVSHRPLRIPQIDLDYFEAD